MTFFFNHKRYKRNDIFLRYTKEPKSKNIKDFQNEIYWISKFVNCLNSKNILVNFTTWNLQFVIKFLSVHDKKTT